LNAAAVEPRRNIGKSSFALKRALRRLAMAQDREMEAECRVRRLPTTNTALVNAKLSILHDQSYDAKVNDGSLTARANIAYQSPATYSNM